MGNGSRSGTTASSIWDGTAENLRRAERIVDAVVNS